MKTALLSQIINEQEQNPLYAPLIGELKSLFATHELHNVESISSWLETIIIKTIYQAAQQSQDPPAFLRIFHTLFEDTAPTYSHLLLNPMLLGAASSVRPDYAQYHKDGKCYYLKKDPENNLIEQHDIFKGGEGIVTKVYNEDFSDIIFADKKSKDHEWKSITTQLVRAEKVLNNLALADHPGWIAIGSDAAVHILYPWMPGENLADFTSNQLTGIPIKERLIALLTLAQDIKKLHDKGYLHHDVKPGNVIYDQKNQRMRLIDYDAVCKIGSKNHTPATRKYYYHDLNTEREQYPVIDLYALSLVIDYIFPDRLQYKAVANQHDRHALKLIHLFLTYAAHMTLSWYDSRPPHYEERYDTNMITNFMQDLINSYSVNNAQTLNQLIVKYKLEPIKYYYGEHQEERLAHGQFISYEKIHDHEVQRIHAIFAQEEQQYTHQLSVKDLEHLKYLLASLARYHLATDENIAEAIKRIKLRLPPVAAANTTTDTLAKNIASQQISVSEQQWNAIKDHWQQKKDTYGSYSVDLRINKDWQKKKETPYTYVWQTNNLSANTQEYALQVQAPYIVKQEGRLPNHVQRQLFAGNAIHQIKYARYLNITPAFFFKNHDKQINIVLPKPNGVPLEKVNCQLIPMKNRLHCLLDYINQLTTLHSQFRCIDDDSLKSIFLDEKNLTMRYVGYQHMQRFSSNREKGVAQDGKNNVAELHDILELLFPEWRKTLCHIKNKTWNQPRKKPEALLGIIFNKTPSLPEKKPEADVRPTRKLPSFWDPLTFIMHPAARQTSLDNNHDNENKRKDSLLFAKKVIEFKKNQKAEKEIKLKSHQIIVSNQEKVLVKHTILLLAERIPKYMHAHESQAVSSRRIYQYLQTILQEYDGLSFERIAGVKRETLDAPIELEDVLQMPYTLLY